ncbi:MAG: sulfatase-like hydrolase/transferase, partial [Verrucomicrobiota bacterium]|nr:sulfatase-like hydrolase/transferase [Verrucomicrobiota bacterium]
MLAGMLANAGWGEKLPNIILILTDDMGWDIAALGHPHVRTPHLDRLVGEGRVFENYYVASPVCSPTRVSFMTGLHTSRFGIHDYFNADTRANWRRGMPNFLNPSVVTVADV